MLTAHKIIAQPPWLVTTVFVVLFTASGIGVAVFGMSTVQGIIVWSLMMAMMLGYVGVWHYSLFEIATSRIRNAPAKKTIGRIFFGVFAAGTVGFLLALIAAYLAIVPYFERVIGAFMAISSLTYFASIAIAARSLVRFEDSLGVKGAGGTIWTFLLELYLPIGVWLLRPRLNRLLQASTTPDQIERS